MGSLATAAPLLTKVFGDNDDVKNLIAKFDFSKIDVKDKEAKDFLHTNLAPSYGNLKGSLQEMDDNLKIMIAGTMKILAKQEDKSWSAVLSTMMQNDLLEPDGQEISRSDKLIKNSSHDFKFDGSADSEIVKEVHSWFNGLVNDDDVLQSTSIDIDVLGRIVAQTGATVDGFETFFAKKEYHEKTMIDIGVLRFPDIDHPHFKLYRIKLVAWSDSSRILFHQEDKNGITGEYNARTFKPRASVIDSLTSSAKQKAIASANALFDD